MSSPRQSGEAVCGTGKSVLHWINTSTRLDNELSNLLLCRWLAFLPLIRAQGRDLCCSWFIYLFTFKGVKAHLDLLSFLTDGVSCGCSRFHLWDQMQGFAVSFLQLATSLEKKISWIMRCQNVTQFPPLLWLAEDNELRKCDFFLTFLGGIFKLLSFLLNCSDFSLWNVLKFY